MQKLKEDFQVVFPGEVYPRSLKAGDEVSDEIAKIAAACGVLEGSASPSTTPAKGRKAASKAPENQASSAAPETK